MKPIARSLFLVLLAALFVCVLHAAAQTPEVKFIADTLVVQAEGTYEADPDLATLTFNISTQEKELKRAYDSAAQSMRRIIDLAERNGLKKDEISTGVLTVAPLYEGDRKKRARAYYVQGQIVLKVRDFSHIGPIIDDSVQDGIADFRTLTYSLADEEAAKERAVAQAMRRAVGRASIALEQKGQKLGALRYASLDVRQLVGVARLELGSIGTMTETVTVQSGGVFGRAHAAPPPPPPPTRPEKIAVGATVQCAFQIQ